MALRILQLAVSPFEMNATLAIDQATRQAALCDPGDEVETLLAWAEREEAEVTRLVATHCHLDHVGSAGEATRAFGLPIELHRADEPLLQGLARQAALFGLPHPPDPPTEIAYLAAGDTLSVGESELRVLHCPGHSPGSLCFYWSAEGESGTDTSETPSAPRTAGQIIAGDVLFNGSIGRTDLPGGNHQQLLDAIRTNLLTLPDDTVVYSGHGPTTTIGAERRHNPFLMGLG